MLTLGIVNVPVCSTSKKKSTDTDSLSIAVDIQQILARKKLVALTDNSSTSYFIYKGEPMGYEYEMLHSFAKYLHVDLEIIVANNKSRVNHRLSSFANSAEYPCASEINHAQNLS